MEELKKAILAHLQLLNREQLKLVYLLIRELVRK